MTVVKLPLGVDGFEKLLSGGYYYIDKTGFIADMLQQPFEVNLIIRPRRFGKSLAMSMLSEYFDIRKNSGTLFEGLEISAYKELCAKWMNQWPVLFLTLKDVSGIDFGGAYGLLQFVISSLCIEHAYLEESDWVDDNDKESFRRLKGRSGDETDVKSALYIIMRMMQAHYGKPVILLVDEYDVPLAQSSENGYYEEMLDVTRSLLGMALKTNPSLKFAVVTGCLRIAKESIFTGTNNLVSNSISEERYSRCFGFVEPEVLQLLKDVKLTAHLSEMRKWYDGYRFGETEVYCPWDVLNHVGALMMKADAKPADYWRNTSHNGIIRSFIDHPKLDVKDKFEILLSGGVIQERIIEDLTYDILHADEDNLWSILYLTGYLTQGNHQDIKDAATAPGKLCLRIPNEEVKTIFSDTIAAWFSDSVKVMDRSDLFYAWWNGDEQKLNEIVTDILFETISYYDYKEDYYHAFIAGLFAGAGYRVISNPEKGTGRPDVVVMDRKKRSAIIIEVKRSAKESTMEQDSQAALDQIDTKQYARQFLKGYKTIWCYGAAFFEKECMIHKTGMAGRAEGAVYEIE